MNGIDKYVLVASVHKCECWFLSQPYGQPSVASMVQQKLASSSSSIKIQVKKNRL